MTLTQLINEYSANAFVYWDRGNGSGFGELGQAIDFDEDRAAAYGDLELTELPEPIRSNDGLRVSLCQRMDGR